MQLTIENPNINNIDSAIFEHINEHNKNYGYYNHKCQNKLVLMNISIVRILRLNCQIIN